jgi:polyhydroxybutyrate depolymerase
VTTRRLGSISLCAALAITACGAGGKDAVGTGVGKPPIAGASACPSAGRHAVDGGRLYVPRGTRSGATPLLVVVLPGGGGDESDRLGLRRSGLARGLALLYPTQRDDFWTLNHAQGDGDLDSVRGLVDRTLASGCFDTRRVTATGVSNGAGFATRLVCALPERFAGVAPVAAGFRALDPCSARTRASFLAIHGTADTVVPFNGRRPGREGSVPRFTARWARRSGCAGSPRVTHPAPRVSRIAHRGCHDRLTVALIRLSGTTHGWPGASSRRFPQRNPSGFKAAPEVVRFALGVRRP